MIRSWLSRRQLEDEIRILAALDLADGWAYGLDLMRTCRMRAGRFYPALTRLADARLIEDTWDDETPTGQTGKHRRRMYRLAKEAP